VRNREKWQAVLLTLAVALLVPLGTTPTLAGPFSGMAGNWSGGGTLHRANGHNDRLRCRARYAVGNDGNKVNLNIRCASDSYKFDLTGYIINNGGTISGRWSEPNYNAAGTLTGRAGAGSISAHAIGNTFSALLSVSTKGTRQSVTIRPQEKEITRVSLSFRKN
jgi:hypothetical protein